MKKSTQLWVVIGAAAGGAWAWMRYGSSATRAASRAVAPGYTSTRYLTDGNGKQIAMQFIYPAVNGVTRTFTVPIDPNGRGYWGVA